MKTFDNEFKRFGNYDKKLSKTILSKITDYIKFNKDDYFCYRFLCKYDGLNYPKCFNNDNGICKTKYTKFPFHLLHSFDGKNIIKCLCG